MRGTMSKQLTLSAAFSVFAMAALALTQGAAATALTGRMQTGATIEAAAPALPALDVPSWPAFSN
jgi:hypothetical protein